MKLRLGFVSNSSSCSFTCPVCESKQTTDDHNKYVICEICDNKLLIQALVLRRREDED